MGAGRHCLRCRNASENIVNLPVDKGNETTTSSLVASQLGALKRQLRLAVRLFTRSTELMRQIISSPALRDHVIAIVKSEGFFGIIRRIRRIRTNLDLIDRSPESLQARPLPLSVWIDRFDTPTPDDLAQLERSTENLTVSVHFIFRKGDIERLTKTLDSLQIIPSLRWQGQIIFDSEISETERANAFALTKKFAQFTNQHQLTVADCVVLISAGTILRPHALALIAVQLMKQNSWQVVYADEIRIADKRSETWFKPEYGPLMASSGRLFGNLVALRTGSAEYQTCLEAIGQDVERWQEKVVAFVRALPNDSVRHLPHVLSITADPFPTVEIVKPLLQKAVAVSIIIPTRNYWNVLKPCLDSLKKTEWPKEQLEIIIVDNGSDEELTISGLNAREQAGEIRVVRHDSDFNWSELNNIGASHAKGEVLVFLNNDIEVIESNWLNILVAFAREPKVGAVGSKLLYPDRSVQHGGVVIGINGGAGHAHLFIDEKQGGYQDLANINREVSAVTGACIAVERFKFEQVGGFDENFKVAFNDIAFCLTLMQHGYLNIYAADSILLHHESKSRGYDTTVEKIARNRAEMSLFWHKFYNYARDDQFYSPNLSYSEIYKLSHFPRNKPAWAELNSMQRTVLMLSVTHAKGHGVPVVLSLQAEALLKAGFKVVIAGPRTENDFPYDGCSFIEVHAPESAALIALQYRVDCVVAHTPPFYSTVRWLGSDFPFIAYDYGEPPPTWFDDANERREVNEEKKASLSMADRAFAISYAIQKESEIPFDGIIPLGNAHLGVWKPELSRQRATIRERLGFEGQFVVLNVCRFQQGERRYKGVDVFVQTMLTFRQKFPDLAERCLFVLCGKSTPDDVREMEQQGLNVHSNVSDEVMKELYLAADAYMNFSLWEGYNLGIAQALAMGLPTLGSDIPAHRAFGIEVSNDVEKATEWLASKAASESLDSPERRPKIWQWEEPLSEFVRIVDDLSSRTKLHGRPAFK